MLRLKELRKAKKMTQQQLADTIGVTQATLSGWENGKYEIDNSNLLKCAALFDVTVDYLLGRDAPIFKSEEVINFEIIGSVAAGYDGVAVETHTGETVPIPSIFLKGHKKEDFFVLQVSGDSMYPRLLDGDLVLVRRCTSVDSGDVAVIIYNGEDATVKKVKYKPGENWIEMVPFNPEYKSKRLEGQEIAGCRILGKVIKLIRDI